MRFTASQYAQALYELLDADRDHKSVIGKFVATLSRHSRLNLVNTIMMEFERVYFERKGIVKAEITTSEKGALNVEKLRRLLGKEVEAAEKVDPNVLGGVRIKIDDWQIDNTVRHRLSKLSEQIGSLHTK